MSIATEAAPKMAPGELMGKIVAALEGANRPMRLFEVTRSIYGDDCDANLRAPVVYGSLSRMVRRGEVEPVRVRGHASPAYRVAGGPDAERAARVARRHRRVAWRIAEALAARGPLRLSQVARAAYGEDCDANEKASTAHSSLAKLIRRGLVEKVADGNRPAYRITPLGLEHFGLEAGVAPEPQPEPQPEPTAANEAAYLVIEIQERLARLTRIVMDGSGGAR